MWWAMGGRRRICSWWDLIPLLLFLAAHGSKGSPSQAPVQMPSKLVGAAHAIHVSISPMQASALSAPSGAEHENWKRTPLSAENYAPSVNGGLPVNPSPSSALVSPANPWMRFAISPTKPPTDASKGSSPVDDSHTRGVTRTSPPHHGTVLQIHTQAPQVSRPPLPLHHIPHTPFSHKVNNPWAPAQAPHISPHETKKQSKATQKPLSNPSPASREETLHSPAPAPSIPSLALQLQPPTGSKTENPAPLSPDSPLLGYPAPPPRDPPKETRKRGWRYRSSPPHIQVPIASSTSPYRRFPRNPAAPNLQTTHAFPPPPPNLDCSSLLCSDPLTNTPPGSPCACVLPIKVGLRLSISLYTFFPLVSELSHEIASGIFMKQSQVHIMGANSANEDPGKTIVLLDLVPHGYKFDYTTAFFIFEKFWHIRVPINSSFFGNYDVLYIVYPGLPPSPPTPRDYFTVSGGTTSNGNNGRTIKPLAVDVPKRINKLNGSLIAIIVLSSSVASLLIVGLAWLLLLRRGDNSRLRKRSSLMLLPSNKKSSGSEPTILGSQCSSEFASFNSSIGTYTGSAKTFNLAEMARATKNFADSRVIGEGGFGRVYLGTLEDGTKVAVKVLKRDDHQGGREFLAEVEMLSRLYHRNLVKLIGICTEDIRCLVYELIPNGSVESHLHGQKEIASLNWNARTKIALGAARGLAYLHEDSSPRVIHRDFKASNILLEHDYTPKVSDFGLARTALGEGNEHISTQVMGTFGYVAPEYAMTGHLLVKSDVYSYGVVLLELLTGMKPVDMLQPPGQENLVTRVRPLLTSKEGLETIIDPGLGSDYPFDNVAKVAAIASMCVQPEVSQRPFMGEVVQALKLVCNEAGHRGSHAYSQDYSSTSAQGVEHGTSVYDVGSFWRHSSSSCPASTGHEE